MARGQRQGVGAITVWMIVFVALWLASTVFLVILYTGHAELVADATRLEQANDKLISRQEESSLQIVRSAKPGGPTVVGLLEEARRESARLATGAEEDDAESIRRKRDQLASTISTDKIVPNPDKYAGLSLQEGMTELYAELKAQHALRTQAEERVKELEAQTSSLVEMNATQKNDFAARAKEMEDRLTALEAAHADYRTMRDARVSELEQEFEKGRTQAEDDITAERERNSALRRDLKKLRERYAAQEGRFGEIGLGSGSLAAVRQPDGHVLTAVPGDGVVYIDRGARDRLILGLQFSVYSSEGGIPADGRAKGRIEVVSISERSAECKILSVASNALVLEGDLIANPIYDPSRSLVFLTIGRFDLDHDGTPDANGAAVIEAMIRAWGGTVADEMTATTDILVVGIPPRQPRISRDATAEQKQRAEREQREWDHYVETRTSARNLSIPAMSQDVFLSFLSGGDRLASR